MPQQRSILAVGAAIGHAAGITGCEKGPAVIQASSHAADLGLQFDWQETVVSTSHTRGLAALHDVADFSHSLANVTAAVSQQRKPFLVMGGDHTCAIGTWRGIASTYDKPIGLLWIDAHLDAHTPKTSLSGNIHGMPLAILLGYGDPSLTCIKPQHPPLDPKHIVVFGVRRYEKEEEILLKKLGVTIYDMEDIQTHGLDTLLKKALQQVNHQTAGFGISFDLDALDPKDAPAVGTPEESGIRLESLLRAYQQHAPHSPIALEIAEFNPDLDHNKQTEITIMRLINHIL